MFTAEHNAPCSTASVKTERPNLRVKVVNKAPGAITSCAWCGAHMSMNSLAFATFFHTPKLTETGCVFYLKAPGLKRIVPVLAAPNNSSGKRNSDELVAICCCEDCQAALEDVWTRELSLELEAVPG